MARRSRRKKGYTPSPDLKFDGTGQADTLSRTAVIVCKLLEQELEVPISQSLVQKISGIPPRSQTRTLNSHSPNDKVLKFNCFTISMFLVISACALSGHLFLQPIGRLI
jgi:hypothetical protein